VCANRCRLVPLTTASKSRLQHREPAPEAIRRRGELGEPLVDIARTYNVNRSTISRLTA
jgi:hypothetical protein